MFEEGSITCCVKNMGFLLENSNENFDLMRLNTYFLKDWYDEENIKEFFINTFAYNELYERVIKTCRIEKRTHFQSEKDYDCVTVNLEEFAKDNENYSALQNIGMEKYILEIINKTSQLSIDKIKY